MNAQVAQNAKSATSPEDIGQQLDVLRADLMKLAAAVAEDVGGGIDQAGQQIGRTGREARAIATTSITDHPLAAVGIAAGLGLLLGLMARKG